MQRVRWDVYCRVIDNFGDIGVCWRLARELGARGESVRLVVDDGSALAWMAPRGAPGVRVMPWHDAAYDGAQVVIEAFGCELPEPVQRQMAQHAGRAEAPRWINLEYLSAEGYVERSHGLPSPQWQGPAKGLVKHFFYPGFTPATGGLLRETGLLAQREAFARDAWLAARGWARRPHERVVVLFGYAQPALAALLKQLAAEPTLLLLARGPLQAPASDALHRLPRRSALRAVSLPFLSLPEFDRLLWSADLAFVRGEDSPVRAIWAGVPFVWQLYPQADGAHHAKLEAFLRRLLADAEPALRASVGALFRAWNDARPGALDRLAWPAARPWRALVKRFAAALAAQDDLVTQLQRFVARRG
ncbi:MAG: elongation factor P maturation arginine rhamnosyltransferase EarP [Burkholderiaceae bacterium]